MTIIECANGICHKNSKRDKKGRDAKKTPKKS
jgi:hypothetical protein